MNGPPGEAREDPLLATKLRIPLSRPDLAPRPRLLAQVDARLRHKLLLLSAPAGFGKTTLLSSALRESAQPAAWLSLDIGDNDPTRFWVYVMAALNTLLQDTAGAPIAEDALRLLRSRQTGSIETVLTVLINALEAVPYDFTLVLDDYHVIDADPIHSAVMFLLEHLPPPMHLVIASRADPPLPLARLRAKGELTELRAVDLRFTLVEAHAFLNQVMGLALSPTDITALEARTEGWIVGLHLAALSLQGRDDAAGFVRAFTGSHRFILDYLADEVLERQPETLQSFLLQTCILDRLSAPLCDAVLRGTGAAGQADQEDAGHLVTSAVSDAPVLPTLLPPAQSMLERLEQANLFLVPLDEERRWYRYHHLFADFLRSRLQQTQPDRLPELHHRAAVWYERRGLLAEAVGHALAAPDFELAAHLVEQAGSRLLRQGELTTLIGWLQALPDAVLRSRPLLCVMHAWGLLLTGRWDVLEPRLQDAEQAVQAHPVHLLPTKIQSVLGQIAAIRGTVAADTGDVPRAVEYCREALQRLPEHDASVRSVVALNMGDAYWISGDLEGARLAFAEANAMGQASENIRAALVALYALAKLQVAQGRLHRSAETCKQAMQLRDMYDGRGLPAMAAKVMADIGMGELLYERNDLPAAARRLTQAIEISQLWVWGNKEILADGYVMLARVCHAQGNPDGARAMIEQAEQLIRTPNIHQRVVTEVAACRMRLWVAQGDIVRAARWAQERGLSPENEPSFARESEHLALMRLLIAQGKFDVAGQFLSQLLQAAKAGARMGRVIEILVLHALAFGARGDTPQALAALTRALSLAEPEDYVRTFVDAGAPMLALLVQLGEAQQQGRHRVGDGISPDYVRRLVAAFGQEPGATPERTMAGPSAFLVEPLAELLSAREREVLRLLFAGHSNQEIAQSLIIGVATVKTHINNIYGKLGVRSRTQAVARARELHLLP